MQKAGNQEYGAFIFEINNKIVKFRVVKTTSKKIGLFVTFYKRIDNDPILPYYMTDPVDLFVINVRSAEYFG